MTDPMTPEDRALCDKLRERVFYGDARLANMKKHDPLGMAALHRIEALSAANAALNDELANLGRENRRLREAVSEVERLREVLERVRALNSYAEHKIGCALYQSSYTIVFPKCSCGLEEVRAALGEKP